LSRYFVLGSLCGQLVENVFGVVVYAQGRGASGIAAISPPNAWRDEKKRRHASAICSDTEHV
jgi:hypothetical protein